MLAIVFTEDQYLRSTTSELLKKIGYSTVLCTDSIDEVEFYFTEYEAKINLILIENNPQHGSDTPFSRMVIKKEYLNLVPLVLISNYSQLSIFKQGDPKSLSRIDHHLPRPFGLLHLQNAIRNAHHRRARLRNKLLVVGSYEKNRIIETLYDNKNEVHWKEVLFADSTDEAEKIILEHPFRIGGVLIDAKLNNPHLITFFSQYKKTIRGKLTPLTILGSDENRGHDFKLIGDQFLEGNDWQAILKALSSRLIYLAHSHDALQASKKLLKAKNHRLAAKTIESILKLDDDRWELLEHLGKIEESRGKTERAILCFKRSLESNPFNPAPYLSLAKLIQTSEKLEVITVAKYFCPHHPQIQELEHHG